MISEFGNIEELMEELGIEERRGAVLKTITKEEADTLSQPKNNLDYWWVLVYLYVL